MWDHKYFVSWILSHSDASDKKKLLTETTLLQGAQLLGVKMNCANLEGANLKGSNFEDPAGSRANLEGVNLKGANLEGSIMAGIFLSL